jgi:hypothetical protein
LRPQTGQLTPIIVRPRKGGGYEIAAGHRRYRAAKLAGALHSHPLHPIPQDDVLLDVLGPIPTDGIIR